MRHRERPRRSGMCWLLAAITAVLVFGPGEFGPGAAGEAAAQEAGDDIDECDRFIESYVRSSARKLSRALDRGDYELTAIELDEPFEVDGEVVGRDDDVQFEVLLEEGGELAGIVDRDRQFEYTYVVAQGQAGPIVVSQAWQPRHLRRVQICEPIASQVDIPERIASSVDVEPFEYWGLRASWRIPAPDQIEPIEAPLEEILVDVVRDHAGVGPVANDD